MNQIRLSFVVSLLVALALAVLFGAHFATSAAADASRGSSPTNLDKTCKPCDNFYEFAMGGWMKANPIPAEYASWGTFTQLRDNNLTAMRSILETAAASKAQPGADEQKIGDFYASCMDTAAIEAAGLKPLSEDFAAIDAINDRKTLDAEIARLQREGANVIFRFGSAQDIKDSNREIAAASQGGLGMPDRDHYLRDDDKSKELRGDYVQHVAKMFELAGDASDKAKSEADTVMGIETTLAKASRTRVELRDPEKNYNLLPLSEIKALTPEWSWENYLRAIGAPPVEQINIRQPSFFKTMNQELTGVPLSDWKVYLRWPLLPVPGGRFICAGTCCTPAPQACPRNS